ncbi:MAG: hypothetical protein HOH08_02645 [Gammaproteobacteria bacterium]|jgi:hypothetical protein|nr:hypothetical protein [Gammaproteobacteria bacterium]MBT5216907.1 hypothetical protein [Gammaproteobacteria bacterium]MBT5542805.1 hypothetical protein [Gammaproteobacteria bacterium]MBT6073829.1 hypothetical protein [Gammaproteobacteria bacterium]MBT7753967.1 hypothetical protein [Gammaproteobacteria bacterium]
MNEDLKYLKIFVGLAFIPFFILILFNAWAFFSALFFPEFNPVAVICGPRV